MRAMLAITALLLVAATGCGGDAVPATATPAPSATLATPSPTPSPCDESNLVNGFLVLAEAATVPGCVVPGDPLTAEMTIYELDPPPGPWQQVPIEGANAVENRVGWSYELKRDDGTRAPGLEISRIWRDTVVPPIARGEDPEPADFLPGPGVVTQLDRASIATWTETSAESPVTYELIVHEASNLDLEQAAALLVFFDAEIHRWDPAERNFVSVNAPPWVYTAGVRTGLPWMDQVAEAYMAGEPLTEFADTVLAPCAASPQAGILIPPVCPDGVTEGMSVPAFLIGACPPDWDALDTSSAYRFNDTFEPLGLVAIAEVETPEHEGHAYTALFGGAERMFTLALTVSGVAGVGGGGDCATPDAVPYMRSVESWLVPPLYPLPDMP